MDVNDYEVLIADLRFCADVISEVVNAKKINKQRLIDVTKDLYRLAFCVETKLREVCDDYREK